jgi:hypothetical protein
MQGEVPEGLSLTGKERIGEDIVEELHRLAAAEAREVGRVRVGALEDDVGVAGDRIGELAIEIVELSIETIKLFQKEKKQKSLGQSREGRSGEKRGEVPVVEDGGLDGVTERSGSDDLADLVAHETPRDSRVLSDTIDAVADRVGVQGDGREDT